MGLESISAAGPSPPPANSRHSPSEDHVPRRPARLAGVGAAAEPRLAWRGDASTSAGTGGWRRSRPRPAAPLPRVKPAEPAAVAQATPPEPGPQPEPARSKSHRTRGRRFVLPPLDEDQDRSAAAIEAFLGGEPPIGTTTERPQRRRH